MAIEIIHVEIDDGEASSPSLTTFDKASTYVVYDTRPFLRFQAAGKGKGAPGRQTDPSIEPEGNSGWWRWCPLGKASKVSKDRTLGLFTIPFFDQELRCYLIPRKLLTRADLHEMVHAVERELGQLLMWRSDTGVPQRAWVEHCHDSRVGSTQLLNEVEEELVAARSLLRNPYEELGPKSATRHGLPEQWLVGLWAQRRARMVAEAKAQLEVEQIDLRHAVRQFLSDQRRKERQKLADEGDVLIGSAIACLQRVWAIGNLQPCVTGELRLTPAMQRDHRQRRLLRAFVSPRAPKWAWNPSPLSVLPPVLLTHLFEVWCAVQLVDQLRRAGFSSDPPRKRSHGGGAYIWGCQWRLRRGDVSMVLDFEPEPRLVENIPAMSERTVSARHWASAKVDDDVLFGTTARCTPDFSIRVTGPRRQVLAIGDASLADPNFTEPDASKVSKVREYRDNIAWRIDGRVITCHELGAFVVYPGPLGNWEKVAREAEALDCRLLCPTPSDKDTAFQSGARSLIECLAAAASE